MVKNLDIITVGHWAWNFGDLTSLIYNLFLSTPIMKPDMAKLVFFLCEKLVGLNKLGIFYPGTQRFSDYVFYNTFSQLNVIFVFMIIFIPYI